ncbi:hypothetical protein Glove_165g159 [Diversispora epigaea]|uniref:BTB domain-containing protein n=1 Tax=Diversispora epigaea TaxID=1348612 RepID=A0A397IX66_9GLOM|nr:hypothetical protein Glove_165g159 [Diversispora epigaea]
MTFKFFDKLSQDFSELLNDKKEYNVIIEVDQEENKKSFTAHSAVLRYRSSYFGKELDNATTNENYIKTIIKSNISAQIFEIILKYIYSGIVDIENSDVKTIYELMINANELELEELSIKLESYLIGYKSSWLKTHFSLVYRSIFDCYEYKRLKKFYNHIIIKHPDLIFESEDFTSLQETILISILKRDDLKVEEIKIWNYVIRWGIAQNPTLPADSEKWSDENFEALKMTLQQCLPLIRYFHISSEDIREKVKPYEKILEKQLWDDIQHHMFPNKPVKSLVLPARIISTPELPSRVILNSELSSSSELRPRIISDPELPSRTISTSELRPRIILNSKLPSRTISASELPSRLISDPELSSRTISTPELPSRIISDSGLPSRIPSKVNEPLSTMINKEHVSELSSWIDRKSTTYSLENIPYEFQLILRGSRDGFHPKTFWNMCHGHVGTIVVAKISGTDEIVGGYNPLAWDNLNNSKDSRIETNDSFIFSLKNGNIQANSIISRVKENRRALRYPSSDDKNIYGPWFGNCEFIMKSKVYNFTRDKLCWCDCSPRYNIYYEKPIRKTNEKFSIVDYEVFKIIKKQNPNCTIR